MPKIPRLLLYGISLILIIIAFNWIVLLPNFIDNFDFSSNSVANIGTTISGLTTPILTVFTAFLLYLTLNKQTEANNDQKLKNDVDIIFLLYNQLDAEYNQLTYTVNGTRTTGQLKERYRDVHVGYDALFEFSSHMRVSADTFSVNKNTDKIKSILNSYLLIQKMLTTISLDKEFKLILTEKIESFYTIKLRDSLKMLCFYIRKNDDAQSKYVLNFVVDQERQLNIDFNIHSYEKIEDLFSTQ